MCNFNYLIYKIKFHIISLCLQITQLTMALQQLKPAEYIVLHGMKGFGKSSLTANILQDERLMKNVFSVCFLVIKRP